MRLGVTLPSTCLQGTREEWQTVWYICAGCNALGAIVYGLLGTGEEQTWAKTTHHHHYNVASDGALKTELKPFIVGSR